MFEYLPQAKYVKFDFGKPTNICLVKKMYVGSDYLNCNTYLADPGKVRGWSTNTFVIYTLFID